IINLVDGETIEIQKLDPETIETIFYAHANYLEKNHSETRTNPILPHKSPFHEIMGQHPHNDPMFRMTIGTLDELGSVMHHNSQQANSPDIPPDILSKIVAITKIVAPEDLTLPKAEPHC